MNIRSSGKDMDLVIVLGNLRVIFLIVPNFSKGIRLKKGLLSKRRR